MKHPSGIDQAIVDKIVARRGRLHAYEKLDPVRTALIVIDMDVGSVRRMREESGFAKVIENINGLAGAIREQGGLTAWTVSPMQRPDDRLRNLYGEQRAAMYEAEAKSGESATISPELDVSPGDVRSTKLGYSALFPGRSDLHEQLQKRFIDTILIVGTVTNVCCESSARDAYELGYKVVMVSDALKGHSFGLHEASLATVFRNFGDVRPTEEILKLLKG